MRVLRIAVRAICGLLAIVALAFGALQTPPGQRLLAAMISSDRINVTGLSGFFPTDLEIAGIALRDEQGAWLTAENVRLRWSFGSLLGAE